jgi:hypothetical protein
MLAEARRQHAVCQVCEVTSRPQHNIDAVLGQL